MATSTTRSKTELPGAGTSPVPQLEPESEPTLDTRAWLQGSISGVLAGVVAVSWYGLFLISAAIEPESSHAVPVIGLVLGVALLAAMGATAVGLAMCRRWGLVAALGASVLLLASAIACPTTGHHTIGTWWYFQMVCSFAAVGICVTALRRS